jgi:hypothetical protein
MRKYPIYKVINAADGIVGTFRGESSFRRALECLRKRVTYDNSVRGWSTADTLQRTNPNDTVESWSAVVALTTGPDRDWTDYPSW